MNNIEIEMKEVLQPKPFTSKTYGIRLSKEVTNNVAEETAELFGKARQLIEQQKKLDNGGSNGNHNKI